jgi:cobalt-precorrin-5B (C1)-methyltransferase
LSSDKSLKWGITTGSCATLAAKAAAVLLLTGERVAEIDIPLPDGGRLAQPISALSSDAVTATATVVKDAGDDPDVTHGTDVVVTVKRNQLNAIRFFAGVGVGTVSKAGLAIPPGEAAINPGPREMIRAALAEVADCGFDVTVAVPGGVKLAEKTFNPRLGIVGGISILGTSGRVRPFSAPALREGLKCALDVAVAAKIKNLVLVPGNMGNKAAQHYFPLRREQIVDVSNEWGFMLGEVAKHPFEQLLVVGHPGKLAKLAQGQWQTHSAQSASAVPYVSKLAGEIVPDPLPEANTVEELFMEFLDEKQRLQLGDRVATEIMQKIEQKFPQRPAIAVVLINLKRQIIGRAGDFTVWRKQ